VFGIKSDGGEKIVFGAGAELYEMPPSDVWVSQIK
jgi:hypothetical protein